jgi:N-formylglutamate amidohydrolase
MNFIQEDFILSLQNFRSPILITVPHGGMPRRYGSWLELFFQKRTDGDNRVVRGDAYVWHVVADMFKKYPANAVVGLLPRVYVDYNSFDSEMAYSDKKLKPFYEAYHNAIDEIIEELFKRWGDVVLLDFHGFSKQPMAEKNFDIILGTSNGESSSSRIDKFIYQSMRDKYQVFCSDQDGLPQESDLYKGDTTNLYYHNKYELDGVLVEISPRFREKSSESQRAGIELADDFATVLNNLEKELKN